MAPRLGHSDGNGHRVLPRCFRHHEGHPVELKIFLLSLAIADDIGAIAVIAIFYSGSLDVSSLIVGLVLLGLIYGMLRLGISQPVLYFVLAVGFWVAILQSGIHATITRGSFSGSWFQQPHLSH